MNTNLKLLISGISIGIVLFAAAFLGKFLSITVLTMLRTNMHNAVILGLSTVPRAEVTMIIRQKGLQSNLVSTELFSAMVFMSITTYLIIPIILHFLFNRCQVT